MSALTEGAALQGDLELAVAASLEAGRVVGESFGTEQEVRHKSPGQPVTEADLAAEEILRLRLAGGRPGYGWLSEESEDDRTRLRARRVWVVDPIDGTHSFIAGRPEFAISVALVEDGLPSVGVLLNPATGELFWAVREGGAWLERVGPAPLLGGSLQRAGGARRLSVRSDGAKAPVLLASRSEIRAGEFEPFHGDWSVQPTGSTAYKMAQVAAGVGDAFVSRGPKSEWDVCAAHLLVEEAGGRVSDVNGEPVRYNRADPRVYGIIASGAGQVHERLLSRVQALGPHPRLVDLEGQEGG